MFFTVDKNSRAFLIFFWQNASLAKIFGLFRGLGLRHVVVVDDDHLVCGMVTRADLVRFQARAEEERREARSLSRALASVTSGTFVGGGGGELGLNR